MSLSPIIRRASQWREQTGSLRGDGKPSCARHGQVNEKSKDHSLGARVSESDVETDETIIELLHSRTEVSWLTRFYDPVVRVTPREATFNERLLQEARIQDGHQILDLGCRTGTLALLVKRAHRGAQVFGLDADRKP